MLDHKLGDAKVDRVRRQATRATRREVLVCNPLGPGYVVRR